MDLNPIVNLNEARVIVVKRKKSRLNALVKRLTLFQQTLLIKKEEIVHD